MCFEKRIKSKKNPLDYRGGEKRLTMGEDAKENKMREVEKARKGERRERKGKWEARKIKRNVRK